MIRFFTKLFYAGLSRGSSAEERKKTLITTAFSLIGFILLTVFGVENLGGGRLLLAGIGLAAALVCLGNYVYLFISGNYRQTSLIAVLIMSALCLWLLLTGGYARTGPLWLFVLPGLVYVVLGLRGGTLYLTVLLCIVASLLFIPATPLLLQTGWDHTVSLPFFSVFLVACVLALAYEYTREDGRRELLVLNKKLKHMSRTDALTGLANRRSMTSLIRHEISRYERHKRPFCLLIGDIDHFKQVNDCYGHECGDLVLVKIAHTLDNNTKKQDIVSRWGGEEFLLLLPETNALQGRDTAERLRQAIETMAIPYDGESVRVTISMGLAEYRDRQSFSEAVKCADKRLYQAKRSGRNRVS